MSEMIKDLIINSTDSSIEFYKEGDDYYVKSNGVDGVFNYSVSVPSLNYSDSRAWSVIVDQQAFKSMTISGIPDQIFIGDVFDVNVVVDPTDLPKSEISIATSDNISGEEIEYGVYRITATSVGDSAISFSLPAYNNAIIKQSFIVQEIPIEPLIWINKLPEIVQYNVGDVIAFDVQASGGEEPYVYKWEDGNGNIYQDYTTSAFNTTASIELSGVMLSVTVTGGGERTISSSTLINVAVPEPEPIEPEPVIPEPEPIEPEPVITEPDVN